MRFVRHDLLQRVVHQPEQGAEPPGLAAGQRGAAEMASFDPGVQGVAAAVEDRDGAAVRMGDGRGDRQAERGEPVGGAVLAGEGGAVAVEVVLEEVAAAGGGEEIAVVEQALGDRFTGQRRTGARVVAEQGSEGVFVGRRRRPDYR